MKFVILTVSLFVILGNVSEAAVAIADFSNPAYPNKCVLDLNHIMSPGEVGKAHNNPCAGVKCMENGKVEFRTCQAVAPGKGCKIRDFVNVDAPFPECCKRTYDCKSQI